MNIKVADKTIKYDLVNGGSTSQAVFIFALPPNRYPIGFYGRVKTAFAGTSSLTVEVGVSGETTRIIRKQPINRAGDLIPFFCASQFTDLQAKTTAQEDIIATFRGADLTALSAGEIEFVAVYSI